MSGILLASVGASFGPSGPPVPIGDPFGGGFFAGQISTAGNGVADYNLVIAPKSSGENSSKQWKTSNSTTSGTTSVIDGPGNTAAMIAASAAAHPAANFCNGLSIGGFSDWYLAATNELELCYYNFKPGTANNVTTAGANANAVPPRASNYTTSDPARTSVTDFQTGNTEAFGLVGYWVSTESSATQGFRPNFFNGGLNLDNKTETNYVRAVRRVAV